MNKKSYENKGNIVGIKSIKKKRVNKGLSMGIGFTPLEVDDEVKAGILRLNDEVAHVDGKD